MAVCEYCQTTILQHGASVEMAGKMSAILEDYSPIQIGTSGIFNGNAFQTIGRIQLRYEDGFWNEWYIWFDDGTTGWLSDASNQFVITLSDGEVSNPPTFESLIPGSIFSHKQSLFIASDVRTARCTSGEGELPFVVAEGWELKAADFRSRNLFLTLDYSESTSPECFVGKAGSVEEFKLQNLRTDDIIAEKAGRIKNKLSSLSCPACGSAIQFVPGVAAQLVCPSCQSTIDATPEQAVILSKKKAEASVFSTLKLGDVATILGIKYTLIGCMRCLEVGEENSNWWEYLLFHPRKGFLWLVESDSGWEQVNVLNNWPAKQSGKEVNYNSLSYQHLYDYQSKVTYAAGAFNWRVNIGDTSHISDFGKGDQKLTLEKTENELSWSLAKKLPAKTVGAWFGQTLEETAQSTEDNSAELIEIAKVFSFLFVMANVVLQDELAIGTIILGLVLLWIPVLFAKLIVK
ncbi:DUF4178 domain-containing protein [Leeia sp. TBRC 13508]|uniref:DUF4178 domain-containing protein n=1 Tax=Leeia speluncae TaxID=2884804 RepID=A0ABS8D4S7_9NEIS|nr:DUF4178 domain-containing protein [Leeia speluncae]MCB6183182.1 DUF4178 domain-containing protein [Leeia speluncae]